MRTREAKTSKTDGKQKKQARPRGRRPRPTSKKKASTSAGGQKKTARSKRPKPKTTRTGSKNPAPIVPEALFPKLLAADGYAAGKGVFIARAERAASALRIHTVGMEQISSKPGRSRRHQSSAAVLEPVSIARILGGLAHADRIRLMIILEAGAQTHKTLADAVALKPGPLYHHLRALERAGLIHSKARNQYDLTADGEMALMIVSGLWALTRKGKRMAPWRRHRSRVNCADRRGKS